MAVSDRIQQYVQRLPEKLQAEVLDFIEFLLSQAEREDSDRDEREWSDLSLSFAMRGMEAEDSPEYTTSDLKETFK